jgi:hypothetical protein
MLSLRMKSATFSARSFASKASTFANGDLSAEIQKMIKAAQEGKQSTFVKVREMLNTQKPKAPTAEELKARRQAARELVAKQTQPPKPLAGPRLPYKLRPVVDPQNSPWPVPHPNWYLYPRQKVFRTGLTKRENNGPLTWPNFIRPRLNEAAPRSYLLSEQDLIRYALKTNDPNPNSKYVPGKPKAG